MLSRLLPDAVPSPPVRFGLDFGTSNTSVAVWDGERSTVLPIDPLAGAAMPTVLYVRRDGSSIVGRPAIETYLSDNRQSGPITREYSRWGELESSNPRQKRSRHRSTRTRRRQFGCSSRSDLPRRPARCSHQRFRRGACASRTHRRVLGTSARGTRAIRETPSEITIGRPVEYIGARRQRHVPSRACAERRSLLASLKCDSPSNRWCGARG